MYMCVYVYVYWCVPMCTAVYWSVPMCTDEYWCLLFVGLGTWAQEHQSNVHCFFYRIRLTIIWSINAHINTHQYWSSVHTSTHYQSTSPPPASFSTSSTFETLQKCALQPNTVPGRLEKQKKQDGPAISHIYIYIYINKKKHLPMGPPLGHRKIILFIYVYIYIYIRNQPIYKHNGTKRAPNKMALVLP
jgi:hypothetical protein